MTARLKRWPLLIGMVYVLVWLFLARANGQTNLTSGTVPPNVTTRVSLPTKLTRLTWLGGNELSTYFGTGAYMALTKTLPIGWARGTMGYDSTNSDTFAWRCVQHASSNDWDWSRADALMAYAATNFPGVKLVISEQWGCRAYTNAANWPGDQYPITDDPAWACALTPNQYILAKAAFINALAARYRNSIWGIEIENEPVLDSYGISRHIGILSNVQPARAYTKIIGYTFQGPWPGPLTNLCRLGFTNLADAVSFHLYNHRTSPPDQSLGWNGVSNQYDYHGPLNGWMAFLRSKVGAMPILVDEIGLYPEVPMRMAKVLIILRAYDAALCQLQVWSYGSPPGDGAAFNLSGAPFPHAAVSAWTAQWLGNSTITSIVTKGNASVYTSGSGSSQRAFAWCFEGQTRAWTPTGYTSYTDIYGQPVSTNQLTDAVMVLNGPGTQTFPRARLNQ